MLPQTIPQIEVKSFPHLLSSTSDALNSLPEHLWCQLKVFFLLMASTSSSYAWAFAFEIAFAADILALVHLSIESGKPSKSENFPHHWCLSPCAKVTSLTDTDSLLDKASCSCLYKYQDGLLRRNISDLQGRWKSSLFSPDFSRNSSGKQKALLGVPGKPSLKSNWGNSIVHRNKL